MTWNYRITKQRYIDLAGDEQHLFEIREVYYEDHDDRERSVKGWTQDPITFGGDSPTEVIRSLEMALSDARQHEVLDIGDYVPPSQRSLTPLPAVPVNPDPHAFQVIVTEGGSNKTVLSTDDWLEANDRATMLHGINRRVKVVGTHPSHEFITSQGETICHHCGAYSNGSYGSQAPCGFDFQKKPLAWHIDQWRASHAQKD